MPFTDSYLRRIARGEVVGDFPPFTLGNITKTENYIRKIVAHLASSSTILVEADFTSYGSGFASYIEVRISRKDHSDRTTLTRNQRTTYEYDGLLLYISRLTPYWFYGGSKWSSTYEGDRCVSGGFTFLTPNSQTSPNAPLWQHTSQLIEQVLQEFRYSLLTLSKLMQPAPADLSIPTVLADKPYTVFDCFFYWQD